MTGFAKGPYDPYVASGSGCGGWLEAEDEELIEIPSKSEPEEDPEDDDPVEQEPEAEESDPEEDPDDHEVGQDYDLGNESEDEAAEGDPAENDVVELADEVEAEHEMDLAEEAEDEPGMDFDEAFEEVMVEALYGDSSSDDDAESEVDDPDLAPRRAVVRRMDGPLPPPAFQVYRHPNGPLWMNTPRKRIPPIRRHDIFRAAIPFQANEVAPPPQEWATQIRDWSREQGLPPPFGLGQRVFHLGDGATADRALPAMVGQISRTDAALATTVNRHHELAAEQHDHVHRIQTLHEEMIRAQRQIEALRGEMDWMRQRTFEAEARAEAAERKAGASGSK